jgi:hypothetical protein
MDGPDLALAQWPQCRNQLWRVAYRWFLPRPAFAVIERAARIATFLGLAHGPGGVHDRLKELFS